MQNKNKYHTKLITMKLV